MRFAKARCHICGQMVHLKADGTLHKHTKTCIPLAASTAPPSASTTVVAGTNATSQNVVDTSLKTPVELDGEADLYAKTLRDNEAYLNQKALECEAERRKRQQEDRERREKEDKERKEQERQRFVGCGDAFCYLMTAKYEMRAFDDAFDVAKESEKKPLPVIQKKRRWREVEVFWNSPFGDTSDLCKGESELQWVLM